MRKSLFFPVIVHRHRVFCFKVTLAKEWCFFFFDKRKKNQISFDGFFFVIYFKQKQIRYLIQFYYDYWITGIYDNIWFLYLYRILQINKFICEWKFVLYIFISFIYFVIHITYLFAVCLFINLSISMFLLFKVYNDVNLNRNRNVMRACLIKTNVPGSRKWKFHFHNCIQKSLMTQTTLL